MAATVKDKLRNDLNPNFTLADFVDGNTEHIKRVQFVYMTDAIEVEDEEPATTEDNSQDEGFFEKLLALFGR